MQLGAGRAPLYVGRCGLPHHRPASGHAGRPPASRHKAGAVPALVTCHWKSHRVTFAILCWLQASHQPAQVQGEGHRAHSSTGVSRVHRREARGIGHSIGPCWENAASMAEVLGSRAWEGSGSMWSAEGTISIKAVRAGGKLAQLGKSRARVWELGESGPRLVPGEAREHKSHQSYPCLE